MTDIGTLNDKVKSFAARDVVTDQTSIFEVVASGLSLRLSELLEGAPASARASLSVYADTLVIDRPSLDIAGGVIFARMLDTSSLPAGTLAFPAPGSGDAMLEICAGAAVGPFAIKSSRAAATWTPPLGRSPLRAGLLTVNSSGALTPETWDTPGALADLLRPSWALNSLRASVAAASYLSVSNDEDVRTARAMLEWVVACLASYARSGPLPSDYAELYYQAAGLLATLTSASGAIFVPILSSGFYKSQVSALIDALERYENDINRLETSADIAGAVKALGGAFGDTAKLQAAPLQTQLNGIKANVDALNKSISDLQLQFIGQQSDCATRLAIMQAKIKEMQGKQFLVAAIKGTFEFYMLGFKIGAAVVNPAEGAEAATAMLEAVAEIGTEIARQIEARGREIADAAAGAGGDAELLQKSQAMLTAQLQMTAAVQTGAALWASDSAAETVKSLPPAMATVTIDPALAWNNWLAVVEARVGTEVAEISGDFSGEAKEAGADYIASLKILANYGKAIAAATVAIAGQLAQGSLVRAQIKAVEETAARWQQLYDQAKNDAERKAAAISLLRQRGDAIKRSIFVAWTYYTAAYQYLYLKRPEVTVNVDMGAAQLRDRVSQMAQWVGRLLGDDPSVERVRLPATDVKLGLDFNILQARLTYPPDVDTALLAQGEDGKWRLQWAVPFGTDQWKNTLPDRGNVAVWITDTKFRITGVKPNPGGNVIAKVLVSGAYQNGFRSPPLSFVCKGLEGDYGYKVRSNDSVNTAPDPYISWRIDTAVYMTPTPFTQWTMVFEDGVDPSNADLLRMYLTVSYLRQ